LKKKADPSEDEREALNPKIFRIEPGGEEPKKKKKKKKKPGAIHTQQK